MGYPHSWMVYVIENQTFKWMMTGDTMGYPYVGKPTPGRSLKRADSACLENAVLVPHGDWDSVGLWVDWKRFMFHGTFYISCATCTSSFNVF